MQKIGNSLDGYTFFWHRSSVSVTSLHCRITSLYIVKNFAFGSEVVKYVEDEGKGLINSCEDVKGKLQNSPGHLQRFL